MEQRTRVACVNSAHARNRYRHMRLATRAFEPRAATSGFPYNDKSVAELQPLSKPRPPREPQWVRRAKEYGYDA